MEEVYIKEGDIIYVAENYRDRLGNIGPNPGGYASKNRIETKVELRNDLAVKEAWKRDKDIPTLRAYRVKKKIRAREGIIGPQMENGVKLSGGGHQYEIIDSFYGEKWKNYLEPIEEVLLK